MATVQSLTHVLKQIYGGTVLEVTGTYAQVSAYLERCRGELRKPMSRRLTRAAIARSLGCGVREMRREEMWHAIAYPANPLFDLITKRAIPVDRVIRAYDVEKSHAHKGGKPWPQLYRYE